MTLNSIILIIIRRLSAKWFRLLLASGGVAVGIWTIASIVSLGNGATEVVNTAVGSQPNLNTLTIINSGIDPLTATGEEKAIYRSQVNMEKIFENDKSRFNEIYPDLDINIGFVKTEFSGKVKNCFYQPEFASKQLQSGEYVQPSEAEIKQQQDEYDKNNPCITTYYRLGSKEIFDTNFSKNITGNINPNRGEVVICSTCGNTFDGDIYKKLGYNEAKDLLGKTITLDLTTNGSIGEDGKEINIRDSYQKTDIDLNKEKSTLVNLKVVGIINDKNESLNFAGGASQFAFNNDDLMDAVSKSSGIEKSKIGFINYNLQPNNGNDAQYITDKIGKKEYSVQSLSGLAPAREFIKIILVAIKVFSYGIGLFGLIALIASVFGIIGIMTMSVLERKKEIGILKSLGAKSSSIFVLFISESMFIGVLGWCLGILGALGINGLISSIATYFIKNSGDITKNLQLFNIVEFKPYLDPLLLLVTFVVSIVFCVLSGLTPSIMAARQNPVESMRSE